MSKILTGDVIELQEEKKQTTKRQANIYLFLLSCLLALSLIFGIGFFVFEARLDLAITTAGLATIVGGFSIWKAVPLIKLVAGYGLSKKA